MLQNNACCAGKVTETPTHGKQKMSHTTKHRVVMWLMECSDVASRCLMGSPLTELLQMSLDCSLCCIALLHWLWINVNALPLLA